MKTFLSLLFIILFINDSIAGVKEGYDALHQGDHKTAIFHFTKAQEEDSELDLHKILAAVYEIAPEEIDNDFKKTFEAYLAASQKPDSYSRISLALMYLFGKGTEINFIKSHEWLLKAVEHADNEAAFWLLGKHYLHGLGVIKDNKKALEYFLRSHAQNGANAQFELGHLYEYGKGVEKNIPKAVEYYQLAAKKGDSEAQYKIDILTGKLPEFERNQDFDTALDYTYGYTVPRDYNKAMEYFTKGVTKGHAASIYNLAYLIEHTSKTKQHKLVAKYHLQAAELGYIYAQKTIAYLYAVGKGIEINKEQSFYWENKAAEQENIESIFEVAESYRQALGVEKNFDQAIQWYQKSAKLGHRKSMYELAQMFEEGEGTDKDFDKALDYYLKSANLGYDKAQNELAEIYYKGEKADKDYQESYKWALRAAQQGYPDSQNKMGVLYNSGIIVEQDMQMALDWFTKAADQGSKKAYVNLGDFYSNGLAARRDLKKAFKWFLKAAKLDDAESQFEVGLMYQFGKGVIQDRTKSLEWYKKSAWQEYREAQMMLGTLYYYGFKDSDEIEIDYKESANWYFTAAQNTNNEGKKSPTAITTKTGTGFFVSPNHIITNNHVTAYCDEIEVKNKTYKSRVELLDTDATTDLTILITGKPNNNFLFFRDRKPLATGEQSIALGYPFSSSLGSDLKVTTGNIAALTGFRNNIAELQLTAPVQPGNSGGPLLDDNGNVIGVIVSRLEKSREITGDRVAQNVNFAIKSNMAKIFMDLNMVEYQVRKSNSVTAASQIVSEAKRATVQVICKVL